VADEEDVEFTPPPRPLRGSAADAFMLRNDRNKADASNDQEWAQFTDADDAWLAEESERLDALTPHTDRTPAKPSQ
jgi:hypothetical protein